MPITVKVKDVMDKNVVTIESSSMTSQAIEKMINVGVWSMIVEREGLPVGVVTDRDILRRCAATGRYPDRVKVEEVMSSPILTINPNVPVGDAMRTLLDKGVRRLYIVEEGKIIGRVTQTGLFKNMLEVMMSLASLSHQL